MLTSVTPWTTRGLTKVNFHNLHTRTLTDPSLFAHTRSVVLVAIAGECMNITEQTQVCCIMETSRAGQSASVLSEQQVSLGQNSRWCDVMTQNPWIPVSLYENTMYNYETIRITTPRRKSFNITSHKSIYVWSSNYFHLYLKQGHLKSALITEITHSNCGWGHISNSLFASGMELKLQASCQ